MLRCAIRFVLMVSVGFIFSGLAVAKGYPEKEIKLVLGYPAGSGIDTVTRELAQSLNEELGVPVIVENKPGALSNIAANYVAQSTPDGYTLLFTPNSAPVANVHLFKELPFDPIDDFTAISPIATLGFVFVVSSESEHNTLTSLTKMLEDGPGLYNFGTGNATGQVYGALYNQLAGLDVTNIPYKGVPGAITDLIGGRLDFVVADASLAIPQIRGGRIKGLAVTSQDRIPALPDVPTMKEAGMTGYGLDAWFGILGPANMPEEIIQKLNESIRKSINNEELVASWETIGVTPWEGEPGDLTKAIINDTPIWGEIIKSANIRAQ